MKSKDFEEIILYRMREHEKRQECTMGRYGVQATFRADETGVQRWAPVSSLPDFEGILPPLGRQFVFEAKVCGQAALAIDDDKFKARQLRHLKTRARYGAISFVLIHWSERVLKTRIDPVVTYAFPVHAEHDFWLSVDRAEVKAITRRSCEEYAVLVPWNTLPGGRTPRPDVLAAVWELAEQFAVR